MNPRLKSWLQLAAVLLLVAGAIGFVLNRSAAFRRSGEENARVWFYDESEKRLYAAAVDILPPDKGVGGKKNDGVRAFVVRLAGASKDPRSLRIAYLQTYAPQLKALLDDARAARTAGKPFHGQIPARDSDFFQTNTLVRRQNDPTWQPSNTPEAQRITSEWRSWRGPNGQTPVLTTP